VSVTDTVNTVRGDSADTRSETEAERQRRLAREAEGIARARASIAAGYFATSTEVNAWIDRPGTGNPLPVPYPRHSRDHPGLATGQPTPHADDVSILVSLIEDDEAESGAHPVDIAE
jgi:hypothetical protein